MVSDTVNLVIGKCQARGRQVQRRVQELPQPRVTLQPKRPILGEGCVHSALSRSSNAVMRHSDLPHTSIGKALVGAHIITPQPKLQL
jgi:hypothetical protein